MSEPRTKWTQRKLNRLRAMYLAAYSYAAMGAELGCTATAARDQATKTLGLTRGRGKWMMRRCVRRTATA